MKITVNQLRRIIREEIEKTVSLNEIDDEPVSLEQEQKVELDKIVNSVNSTINRVPAAAKYLDLSKMFTQGEMANALINNYYKVIPEIMGVDTFDNPKVWEALIYMFPEMRFNRSSKGAWHLAGPLANSKGMTLSRPTPKDAFGMAFKPEDELKYKP